MNNNTIKILVIEDELEIRANLLELLEMEGYSVIGADNSVTGLLGALYSLSGKTLRTLLKNSVEELLPTTAEGEMTFHLV